MPATGDGMPAEVARRVADLAGDPDPRRRAIARGIARWGYHRPVVAPWRVTWDVTARCNLNCAHCSSDAGSAAALEMDRERALAIIDRLAAFGIERIAFTGGEVLLHRDFMAILEAAGGRTIGFTVATNATLVTLDIAARLKSLGTRMVQTSLDGPSPGVHDHMRGTPGAFKAAVAGIKLLLGAGIPVVATMTITSANADLVAPTVELALELGIPAFTINDLILTGRARAGKPGPVDQPTYDRLIALFADLRRRHGDRIKLAWEGAGAQGDRPPDREASLVVSRCLAAFSRFHIDAAGEAHPCNLMHLPLGSVETVPLADIWLSPPLERLRRRDELGGSCGRCDYRYSCGGCRARAYAATGDLLAADPRCTRGART